MLGSRRGSVWWLLELIAKVYFEVYCVFSVSSLRVVRVVLWIKDGYL
jgi:hypothetical protein